MKIFKTFLTRVKETDPQLNFPAAEVRILSLAVPPNHPVSPKRGMIVVGGVLFGLFAAAGTIVLKNQTAAGLRTRADVEKLIGAPLIGAIPFLQPARAGGRWNVCAAKRRSRRSGRASWLPRWARRLPAS